MKLGIMTDPVFRKHVCGTHDHPERPERLEAALRGISTVHPENAQIRIPARNASIEELRTVHDPDYVTSVLKTLSQGGYGNLDPDTFYSPDSHNAALRAVGGGIDLALAVENRDVEVGFVIARPPGHHATTNRSMGFCIFNNIGVAAANICETTSSKRVAIFDWDVHHGNGTQAQFFDNPNVLFISIHQSPFYPGTGYADEMGGPNAPRANANIPFPAGATNQDYLLAMDALVLPLIEKFDPGHILISAGFDAHHSDPLAGMQLTTNAYLEMASRMKQLADRICNGKLSIFLEGGYRLDTLEKSLAKTVRGIQNPTCSDTPPWDPNRAHHTVIRKGIDDFLGVSS